MNFWKRINEIKTEDQAMDLVVEMQDIRHKLSEELTELELCDDEEREDWWTLEDEVSLQKELGEKNFEYNILKTQIDLVVNAFNIYDWWFDEYCTPWYYK